jgi:hypothetical protein
MGEQIFISYRHKDSPTTSGDVYRGLARHFGYRKVFKDVYNIPPAATFKAYIQQAMSRCVVVLVVIGPHWLDAADDRGQRCLDNPDDLVRIEIEMALRQRTHTASMHKATSLPSTPTAQSSSRRPIPPMRSPSREGSVSITTAASSRC